MGRPEKEVRCRKHQSHKNINGVCPYCLRDRLENLSGSSASSTANAASSTSASSSEYSSYESDSSSSFASPPPEQSGRSRLLQLLKGGRNRKALRRSKSFSNISKEAAETSTGEKSMIKKGAGKLLAKLAMVGVGAARRRQGEGGLTHSKTVKEKNSSKWAAIFS